jgi:hypothetical protein
MVITTQPRTLKILFATFAQSFCGLRVKGINSIEAAMDAKFTQGDRRIAQRSSFVFGLIHVPACLWKAT